MPDPSAALMELLQNVATGIMSAGDAAVQLNAVVGAGPQLGEHDFEGGDGAVGGSTADDDDVEPVSVPGRSVGTAGSRPREGPAPGREKLLVVPEVVWGEGKTAAQVLTGLQRIAATQGLAAATRMHPATAEEVVRLDSRVVHNAQARMVTLKAGGPTRRFPGSVALICAGTAAQGVVEECRLVLQAMGCYAFKLPESGVMGMHRIVRNLDAVRAADVVIAVSGMDGGIASVVAGIVDAPVIALPTSAGYGTAFGGVTPLLASLNSAAPGVTVVNIDSGFGAAMAAWRILVNAARVREAALGGR